MKEGINKPRYIIADDFTGANDVGVALVSSGIATKVLLATDNNRTDPTSVGVICTNSRDLEANEAKLNLQKISDNYQLAGRQSLLIKKVDSTLRGNIGSEIEALLDSGYSLTIVAIAAPQAKRKTTNGLCYVDSIPLSETEFASDPKSPIYSSRVKDIIESQTTYETVEYLLPEQNSELHEQSFVRLYDSGAKIIVCDCETYADLFDLYQAATQINIPTLFVTTGELTHTLVDMSETFSPMLEVNNKPILAIIGSMSEMTLKQSQYLIDNNEAEVIDLNLKDLFSENREHSLTSKVSQATTIIRSGNHCIVRSCRDTQLRHSLKAIAAQHELSQKQLAEHVRECLADLAYQIIEANHQQLGGMILCGGDIAIATAQRLNAPEYQIGGIVADCVPWGLLDSELTPFPIFTKAGGFGNPATFSQVIQHLQKEVR